MSNIFARFVKDESGATAIEYGLIAALIALGHHGRRRRCSAIRWAQSSTRSPAS